MTENEEKHRDTDTDTGANMIEKLGPGRSLDSNGDAETQSDSRMFIL